ncbi:MAG: hypothetical protein L3J19_02755 [Sulfurimonas sp.]|nr:hypothetical protein [Sulfurimonas sp.]
MHRLIFLSVSLLLVFSSHLSARSTFYGQKIYLKECRTCHMGSKIFLNMHTFAEWDNLLDVDGSSLSYIHLSKSVKNVNSKDGTIKDSHSYFKSTKYRKQYWDLKNFIIRFAQKSDKSFYNQ